jgi:DNA-directed RNA polymerase specialized sigma24 family protein
MSLPLAGKNPAFPTTSWSLIKRVQKGSPEDAAKAMEEICRQYWYPIYAFARRSSFAPEDAEDMAQTFFQNLVADDAIRAAREEKGRLRAFMLAVLKRLISKQIRYNVAEKRGGTAHATLSWDELTAEEHYALEPATLVDPDALFDRAWAERVLDQSARKLREEFALGDNLALFEAIQDYLPYRTSEPASYPLIAANLAMNEGAVRQQVSRMRKRYAALIEQHIAQTVEGEDEQREELQYLVSVMVG